MDSATALRVAGAFGGGMGRMGLTCGTVTAGMMVIGLKYGQVAATDKEAKQHTYTVARQFAQDFATRNGSITCSELLGAEISDPEQWRALRERGAFESLCPRFVSSAVSFLEELLAEA
jgi:C_GCAxxG_C_C family probable redox protein